MNLSSAPAAERDLADAVDRFDRPLHLFVRNLGQRPEAHRRRGQHDGHHRVGVGIDLLDHRRQQLRRDVLQRARDLFTHVVRRVVDVALEHELHRDLTLALADPHRRHLVDARDAAQRLLERLDDGAGHLVGARAGKLDGDVHRRGIGARKQIDAEIAEREDAEDHEGHDEHRGKDRAANAQFREHRGSLCDFEAVDEFLDVCQRNGIAGFHAADDFDAIAGAIPDL